MARAAQPLALIFHSRAVHTSCVHAKYVVAVLAKHEAHVLLNIANEAGDGTVTADAFVDAYTTAVKRLRATGLKVPLVIDAPSWGQDIDMLQATGATLTERDSLHNLLFSVHMWWNDPTGERVRAELAESVAASSTPRSDRLRC